MIQLIGNGLDALVASKRLMELGQDHRLIADKSKLGGHFRGANTRCRKLIDNGMVLLEPDSRDAQQRPVQEYQGESGPGIRPFIKSIFEWMNLDLVQHQIVVSYRSQTLPDYFISDSLDAIAGMPEGSRLAARHQLENIVTSLTNHPRNKNEDAYFSNVPLSEYLEESLGPALKDFLFSSWLRNYDPHDELTARDHRLIWIPLYWPETLLGAIRGTIELNRVPFFSLKHGPVSEFVRGMVEEVDPHLELSEPLPGSQLISFRTIRVNKPASSTSLKLIHFCVGDGESLTTFLPDFPLGFGRLHVAASRCLVDGSSGKSAILEIPNPEESDAVLLAKALELLSGMDYETSCEGEVFNARIPLQRSDVGGGEGFDPWKGRFGQMGSSFNEQVARGLATAERVANRNAT